MVLTEPTPSDIARLGEQWLVADRIVRELSPGSGLDQTTGDLARLQLVIDSKTLDPSRQYELQCLGVALGRVLATNVHGLDWAIVDDEYGRDPTIRYRQSSIQFNVLTMISKRVESGGLVDVAGLYERLCADLAELVGRAD